MTVREATALLGQRVTEASEGVGFGLVLLGRATLWVPRAVRRNERREVFAQLFHAGVETIPVVLVVSVFTGMIMSLNGGITLEPFGQESLIGRIVAVSMIREMGPFMTALILAASVGSGMAAEIGTMTVSEEVDAIRMMAIDPAKFLVMPRIIGLTVMCFALSAVTSFVGILGGALVAYAQLGVDPQVFKNDAVYFVEHRDLYTGLAKALVFGVTIATVGCTQGLRARGGAIGVGNATRRAVVISYVLIIVLGYYITWFFYR